MALVLKAKEEPMTVVGNGPVRFYIVYRAAGQGEIVPSDYVLKSRFASIQEDWTKALPKMAQQYPGRAESLEIDCHGAPGILFLLPQLNLTSLHSFAGAVGGLLRPYGLVEFLACHVANFDVPALAQYLRSMGRTADADFLRAWLQDSDGLSNEDGRPDVALSVPLKRIRNEGIEAGKFHIVKCPYSPGTVEATTWQSGWDSVAGQGGSRGMVITPKAKPVATMPAPNLDHARVARLAIQSGLMELGDSFNGPLFCSRAARALRCKVQAAMAKQPAEQTSGMGLDEFLMTHRYQVMPTGNWAGHVYEFSPSGGVSYLGFDVPRPVYVPMTPGSEGRLRPA